MNPVATREELLTIIDDERSQWDTLVASIQSDQLTTSPVSGHWTFRDLTAHLLAWREWGFARLNAATLNRPEPRPPYPPELESDDDINAWFHERDLNRSSEDVTTAFSSSFDRLKQTVGNLSERELADPDRFPYLEGEALGPIIADRSFFEHIHVEHGPDIEDWLEAIQSAEFRAAL